MGQSTKRHLYMNFNKRQRGNRTKLGTIPGSIFLVYIVYIELSAYAPCGAKDRLLKARLDGSVLVESMYEEEGF